MAGLNHPARQGDQPINARAEIGDISSQIALLRCNPVEISEKMGEGCRPMPMNIEDKGVDTFH